MIDNIKNRENLAPRELGLFFCKTSSKQHYIAFAVMEPTQASIELLSFEPAVFARLEVMLKKHQLACKDKAQADTYYGSYSIFIPRTKSSTSKLLTALQANMPPEEKIKFVYKNPILTQHDRSKTTYNKLKKLCVFPDTSLDTLPPQAILSPRIIPKPKVTPKPQVRPKPQTALNKPHRLHRYFTLFNKIREEIEDSQHNTSGRVIHNSRPSEGVKKLRALYKANPNIRSQNKTITEKEVKQFLQTIDRIIINTTKRSYNRAKKTSGLYSRLIKLRTPRSSTQESSLNRRR